MTLAFVIFNQLTGSWILSRTVSNFGTMQGKAIFTSIQGQPDCLFYREEGVMTLKTGVSQNFFKEYIYGYSQDKITIYFKELPRKIYHELNLSKPCCEADHQCLADSYHGLYDFTEILKGRFNITYNVKGPNKGNVIVTQFIRE